MDRRNPGILGMEYSILVRLFTVLLPNQQVFHKKNFPACLFMNWFIAHPNFWRLPISWWNWWIVTFTKSPFTKPSLFRFFLKNETAFHHLYTYFDSRFVLFSCSTAITLCVWIYLHSHVHRKQEAFITATENIWFCPNISDFFFYNFRLQTYCNLWSFLAYYFFTYEIKHF